MAKQSNSGNSDGNPYEPRMARKIKLPKMAPAHTARKGFPFAKAIFAVIGLLVIGAIAFLLFNYAGSAGLSALPAFKNLNAPIKPSLAALPGLQSMAATQELSNLSYSHLSNISEFTVNYNGKIYAHGAGAQSLLAFNSPLDVSLSKYAADHKLDINVTNAAVFGDLNIVYLADANGTYTCENFNSTAASSGNQNGVLFGSRATKCAVGTKLLGINLDQISNFDLMQLSQFGLTPSYTTVYQSQYLGQNCTYISGTLTQTALNGTNTGSGIFGMCLSNTYYVPLSMAAIFSGSYGSFSFYLNEAAISNSSSQPYIETLPGQVN